MSLKHKLSVLLAAAALMTASAANATVVTVDALANTIIGGTAKATGIFLQNGQTFKITVDPTDTWNFGGGNPAYTTNADGMWWTMPDPIADDHEYIGHFGALVGQIGNGHFFTVGTSFNGQAGNAGELKLWHWDSGAGGNIGSVEANVAVPEPGSLALIGLGLAALARRRRSAV